MRFSLPRWPVLIAVVGIAACATWFGTRHPRGRHDEIRFSHQVHKQADLECGACHEDLIASKALASKPTLPNEAKCLECHGDEKEKGNCAFCHRDGARPATYPVRERSITVNHAEHIKRAKDDCSVCHKALPELAPVASLVPAMDTCTSCHNHKADFDEGRCQPCHVDLTRYPLRPVAQFSHGGDFVRRHGRVASASADSCTKCHDQTFCADCHARNTGAPVERKFSDNVSAGFVHRGDFVGRHAVEARADQAMCRRCHGESYCTDCHRSQNLVPDAKDPRSPHPPLFSQPNSPNSHALIARRDIASCASCHDQGAQSNCVGCHKVGGIGGNPHPAGWNRRHEKDDADEPVCRVCHQ